VLLPSHNLYYGASVAANRWDTEAVLLVNDWVGEGWKYFPRTLL